MPTFKKGHKYVYINKGKPTLNTITFSEDREVSDAIFKQWKEVKLDPKKNK